MKTASIILLILVSCIKVETNKPLNSNGDSELAVLMRKIYEDGQLTKAAILKDEKLGSLLNHKSILTASATQPNKAKSELYQSFAENYLNLIEELNDPENLDNKTSYNNMVNSCINCHKSFCPGPIVRINKMKI